MKNSFSKLLASSLSDGGWRSKARPEQLPPTGEWFVWLLMAGRGFGKTRTGAEWVQELAESKAVDRIALVGPTAADTRDVMAEGPSGILAVASVWCRPTYEPSKRRIEWPNGVVATLYSAEEPDRLRGPQHGAAWCDELAAWNNVQYAWDMLQMGLRMGQRPRALVTTTPRPIKLIKDLLLREGKDVVVTRGSTFDNAANLAPNFLEAVKSRYEGTRLGRQELQAELLSDTPGALWTLDALDANRIEPHRIIKKGGAEMARIVVAVDPAVSNSEGSDETGIVVAGIDEHKHAYVLQDLSGRYQPAEWATKAINAYHHWQADRIVAEVNQGGAMVAATIRNIDPNVALREVHASRGKVLRAEPISALYEQNRVSHVGTFQQLEDQMCSFTSDFNRTKAGYSPDRVDALVFALTELTNLAGMEPPVVVPYVVGTPRSFPGSATQQQSNSAVAPTAGQRPPTHYLKSGQKQEPWMPFVGRGRFGI
jgi:phage terminase large subunit-like protein